MTREASVPMTKPVAKLSAADFLHAIQGKTTDHEVEGVGWVTIRSLTTPEVGEFNDLKGGSGEKMLYAVVKGLVEPTLTPEEAQQLATALPGPILDLSAAIAKLSGIQSDSNGLEGEAGAGS